MIQTVPQELTFRLYSRLRKNQKTDRLRRFFNDFSKAFGADENMVSARGNWRKRLDQVYLERLHSSFDREILIAYWERKPVGAHESSFVQGKMVAYDEGIYVDENQRRKKIGTILRDVLLSYLTKNKFKVFYIRKNGFGFSGCKIRKSKFAQALAKKDIRELSDTIIELETTPIRGWISSYGIDLRKYSPRYQPISF